MVDVCSALFSKLSFQELFQTSVSKEKGDEMCVVKRREKAI